MRKLGIGAALLLWAATMSFARPAPQSSDQQSAADQAKGTASSAASTVKHGAETGANKTKEGAEKAYGAAKDAVTGHSNEQSGQAAEQGQAGAPATSSTSSGHLPQTASPLPLLSLLGVSAFSLGAWKSRWFRRH